MQKYKCTISYDGTNYSGFQIQPEKRTIQGKIEEALATIHKGKHIRIYSSGRTDTGVHAIAQTFHFKSSFQIPCQNWKRALNALLPHDIYVQNVITVDDSFHARFSAREKEYRYYILNRKDVDIFKRNYVYQYPYLLNLSYIREACHYLQGTHDFTTFSSAKATVKGSRVRTLSKVWCHRHRDTLEFIFKGNGFLYHMVRIMVGALIDVGRGKIHPTDIPHLLKAKDRQLLGQTAPPQGLYLWRVIY